MRIWFDTEFLENGETIKLISIGLVREDGATYYQETGDATWLVEESDWLREHVKPHLRGCTTWPNSAIGKDILAFAGPNPEFWAYYADYDWVALCQLFGRMIDLPKGWPMYCRDLQQAIDLAGVGKPPKQEGAEHNALADALWTRDAWLWLQRETSGGDAILIPHRNDAYAAAPDRPASPVVRQE